MASFTVLTLNWNGLEVLPAMVESLAGPVEELGGDLVVFDNDSSDGSHDMVERQWGSRSWFRLVRSKENLGFAGGASRAIDGIDSEIIVLANSDTVFLPGSLEELLRAAEEEDGCGVIGPRLLWPDGTLQRSMRDFPFPGALLKEHLPFLRRTSAVNDPHTARRTVDWLVGAVMVFRREVFLECGGFDRDFFFYHEETELQYRLTRMGYPSIFIPAAEVMHVEGASARKKFGNTTYTRYIQAKIKFLRKHGYTGSITLFRAFMGILQGLRLVGGFIVPGLAKRDIRFSFPYCRKALAEVFRRNGQDNR